MKFSTIALACMLFLAGSFAASAQIQSRYVSYNYGDGYGYGYGTYNGAYDRAGGPSFGGM